MVRILGVLLAVILAVLSLFHLYWSAGGRFDDSRIRIRVFGNLYRLLTVASSVNSIGFLIRAVACSHYQVFHKAISDSKTAKHDKKSGKFKRYNFHLLRFV